MALASPRQHRTALRLFDEAESQLLARALIVISKVAPGDAEILSRLMAKLAEISQVVWSSPSLRDTQTLGGKTRDAASLIDHLGQIDGLSGDLDLPIKATLQRTFLMAKIQFLRGFVKSACALRKEEPELVALSGELREELAQSIYTLMAEELLLALLRKPAVSEHTKRRAAAQLITIWDNATLEIDEFCPFLERAWQARNRINADLGSLLGATEYFRLVAEDCSVQFLDYFSRDEVSEAENQAFAEFLFGLTWEELATLREEMKRQGIEAVSEEWASRILGRRLEHECEGKGAIDPVSLYRSYQRRQLAADFRILAGSPGPRRTAEAYLMVYLLDQQKL